jgi:peptide/nickel transport system substrate-binding protein
MAGYDPAIALTALDPAKARALLAEAGYPQGFKLTLHSTAGRYANDQQQAEAIAQMLSRIGIQTTVETQPVGMFFQNARRQAFTFNIVSWGFATGDTYVLIRETLHSKGLENYGRHTNPAIDAVLDQARTDTNPTSRGNAIAQAQRLAIQDVAVIPTHYQLNLWAGRRGLRMEPRMDEMTLGQDIFPAQ